MTDQCFTYECECATSCKGELYFQPDTIKGNRLIMLGTTDGGDEANVWLTPADARKVADDLLALVAQIEG